MPNFFAACPKGIENLLSVELQHLGAANVKETVAGVSFSGTVQLAMRVCLWSRFASRVLQQLVSFPCNSDLELYLGAYGVPWDDYFLPQQTIAVEFSGSSDSIKNTQYGAQKVKDAVCDFFVRCSGIRPDVDKRDPQILIYAHLHHEQCALGLDLSGGVLFRREFDRDIGAAPLKENLAAAMLVRSGYQGGSFFDPMCGSGTLLWEAGLILTDTAPGLLRSHYGFFNLKTFDKEAWLELQAEALRRSEVGKAHALEAGYVLCGCDADLRMIEYARENAQRCGFLSLVRLIHSRFEDLNANPLPNLAGALTIVTNPPYGERMGNFNELILLYSALGAKLKTLFPGARLGVISSSEDLLSCLRLKGEKSYTLYNGSLACQLRVYTLATHAAQEAETDTAKLPAADFVNRLRKNAARLKNYINLLGLNCYRLYDADIPEYNAAVDVYGDYVVLQEYQAPASVAPGLARRRLLDMIAALQLGMGYKGRQIIVKNRQRQLGAAQYEKNEGSTHIEVQVCEGGLKFKARLDDYLDSGIFFDSRPLRALIGKSVAGKDFLNLFAYTCTASVSAAAGGASSTLSVDMSRTYLEWGMENFELNGLQVGKQHQFLQADCLSWLSADGERLFDLIYIDPPTFSNSKRMSRSFEVQRDHVALLANLTRHLKDGGAVIFCCNKRGFKLSRALLEPYGYVSCEDLSAQSIPPDCAQDGKIHSCFKLTFIKKAQLQLPEPMVELQNVPRWSKVLKRAKSLRTEHQDRSFRSQTFPQGEKSARKQGSFSRTNTNEVKPRRNLDRAWGKESHVWRREEETGTIDQHWAAGGTNQQQNSFRNKARTKGFPVTDKARSRNRHDFSDSTRKREEQKPQVRVWGPQGIKEEL